MCSLLGQHFFFCKMDTKDQRVSDDDKTHSLSSSNVKFCNVCVGGFGSSNVLYSNTCQEKLKKSDDHKLVNENMDSASVSSCIGMENDLIIIERISEEMKLKNLVFDRLVQRCDEVSSESDSIAHEITKEINFHFDKYIEAVEKQRNRLLQQVREHSCRHSDVIKGQKLVLSGLQENVNEARELLGSIKSDSLPSNSKWRKLSRLLVDIRRANVHVTPMRMTFTSDANGPVIDGYQFYGQIVIGRECPDKCYLDYSGMSMYSFSRLHFKILIFMSLIAVI